MNCNYFKESFYIMGIEPLPFTIWMISNSFSMILR